MWKHRTSCKRWSWPTLTMSACDRSRSRLVALPIGCPWNVGDLVLGRGVVFFFLFFFVVAWREWSCLLIMGVRGTQRDGRYRCLLCFNRPGNMGWMALFFFFFFFFVVVVLLLWYILSLIPFSPPAWHYGMQYPRALLPLANVPMIECEFVKLFLVDVSSLVAVVWLVAIEMIAD